MLLALTDATHFSKTLHYFPVRGHSFLPCDRGFAIIKPKLRKKLILTSSTANKFLVKEVKTRDVNNFKNWWPKLYKKNCVSEETLSKNTPRNSKVNFNISTYSQFVYDSENKGCVVVSEFIDGAITHSFKLKQPGNNTVMFPSTAAYPLGKVPIKSSKMEHIKKCAAFVTDLETDVLTTNFLSNWIPSEAPVHWKYVEKSNWTKAVSDKINFEKVTKGAGPEKYWEADLLKALNQAKIGLNYYSTKAACVVRGLPVKIQVAS
nr:unnamed protein product [Callosobruchus analis]